MAGDIPSNITTGRYVRQIVVTAAGPQGPAGTAGTSAEDIPALVSYYHIQSAPATTWSITHNLGFYPNVTTLNSAGDNVEGVVAYPTLNSVTITFSEAISGKAYLS